MIFIFISITSFRRKQIVEPVTTAEMQALEEEEERILAEAMKRRARDGLVMVVFLKQMEGEEERKISKF